MEVGMVKRIDIDEEMQQAYLDYAMSVIVARALPDARDGLKPVHRRILYAMHDMGLRAGSSYKKSARIVGEVLGKYHPHGDMAVYDAMARMAQDFSMRYLLVDGQGNFGSVDGDPPAAMRYTEARLAQLSQHMLSDIQKNTVDFASNFDDTLEEPTVLPAAVPNLLVNGATGIAVGMATSIPPHNLGEVVNALKYMLENWNRLDDLSLDDLMQFIQGPDFPTGGVIIEEATAAEGLSGAYGSGRGRVTVQARAHLEEMERGRSRIIVTELPYMTNKATLIERIAELVREEKLDGISDLRDESDRQGMRIVIELSKNADPEATLRGLYRHTPMQGTFSMILLALVDGEPRLLSLKQALRVYLDHRLEIVKRRSQHDLAQAQARAHILEGLRVALKNLDEIIDLIRKAPDVETARARLMKRYKLSEIQAGAILDMQLRRLAALERKKIEEEYKQVQALIKELEALLRSPARMRSVVSSELETVQETYGDRRRTQIIRLKAGEEKRSLLTARDLTPDTNVWVAVTAAGKISRSQEDRPPRLAEGGAALQPGAEALRFLVRASTRDTLYLASARGETAALAVASLPEAEDPQRGAPIGSLSVLKKMDDLAAVFTLPPRSARPENHYLLTVTHQGMVKKSALEELPGPSAGAFTLVRVNEGDRLGWAYETDGSADLLLVSARGAAIRFTEEEVRPMGLVAAGVMGIKLPQGDELVGVELLPQAGRGVEKDSAVFLAASDGTAKRVAVEQFPKQGRYGQGVSAWKLPKGRVAGSLLGPKEALAVVHMEQGARVIRLDAAPLTNRAARGGKVVDVKAGGEVLRLSPGGLASGGPGKTRGSGKPGGTGGGSGGGPEKKAPSRAKKSLPQALETPAAGSNGRGRKPAAKAAPAAKKTAGKTRAAAESGTAKAAAAKKTAPAKAPAAQPEQLTLEAAAGGELQAAPGAAKKKAAASKTTAAKKTAASAEKPAAKAKTGRAASAKQPAAQAGTAKSSAAKTTAGKKPAAGAEKPAAKAAAAKTTAEKKTAAPKPSAKAKTGSAASEKQPAAQAGTAKSSTAKTAAQKKTAEKKAPASKPAAAKGGKAQGGAAGGARGSKTPGMSRKESFAAAELPGLASKKPAAKKGGAKTGAAKSPPEPEAKPPAKRSRKTG